MAMRFGCCCNVADPCKDCVPDVGICCLKVTRSDWAHPVVLKRSSWNVGDSCAYYTSNTNICGRVDSKWTCNPAVSAYWHTDSDCTTTTLHLQFAGGKYPGEDAVDADFVTDTSWYLGTLSFSSGGIDFTVEVCPVDVVSFGEDLPTVVLFVSNTTATTGVLGNTLCGGATCSVTSSWWNLKWSYDIWTDTIKIEVSNATGFIDFAVTVDYDGGNWINAIAENEAWELNGVDFWVGTNCGDHSNDPNCEAWSCYPKCWVNTCDGGITINASATFLTVSGPCTCLNGDYEYTWDGSKYYSGIIGDVVASTCARLEIWWQCAGATLQRRVRIVDLNGVVSDTTEAVVVTCTGSDIADTFSLLSSISTPLCDVNGTITVDTYTNNA